MKYFITATGTDSGKTLVAAVFCQALQAAYWKPIQAGLPTDSEHLRTQLSPKTTVFPEAYCLQTAMAPHAAAAIEGITLDLQHITPPIHHAPLVIEGAGGLLVPLNNKEMMIDLLLHCQATAVLVINTYLGCINHALLSTTLLRARKIPVQGIVFNGPAMPESEEAILSHSGYRCLLRIPTLKHIDAACITHYAGILRTQLQQNA